MNRTTLNRIVTPVLTALLLPSAASLAQPPDANPTRPAWGDNAFLAAPGHLELETGLTIGDNDFTIPTLLKASIITNMELGFLMSGIVNHVGDPVDETEVGDPGVQAKYQALREENAAVSVAGRLDFTDPGTRISAYVTPSLTPLVGRFDATFGFTHLDGTTSVIYAVDFFPKMIDPLKVYAEIYGEAADNYSPTVLDAGLLFSISPDFVVDGAFGVGLNDDAPDWQVQIGLTKTLAKIL